MDNATDHVMKIKQSLMCLVTASKILGIPADYSQLERAFVIDEASVGTRLILRAAKELGLKARETKSDITRLPNLSFPIIALLGLSQNRKKAKAGV